MKTNSMLRTTLPLCALMALPSAVMAFNTTETVFSLSDDMKSANKYFSKRADGQGTYSFLFGANFNPNLITYARPSNYRWENTTEDGTRYKALRFPGTSSYAYLERITNRDDFLEKDKDNPNRYYLTVDGSTCMGATCMQDESIISVNVPTRFKVLNYFAKVDGKWPEQRTGDWKIVDNTYTFYRRSLKGAMVGLYLEDAVSYGYNQLTASFAANKNIQVNNEGNRIRVVIPVENLFASGSASMSKQGLEWIKILSQTLKEMNYVEARVEGHTDDQPLSKKAGGFSNNWELSSMRATNVVLYLLGQGVPNDKIAAVGYADSHPIASNATAEGRAKNRRIEFSIMTEEAVRQGQASEQATP